MPVSSSKALARSPAPRWVVATETPTSVRALAAAAPRPCTPPVTRADWFWSLIGIVLSVVVHCYLDGSVRALQQQGGALTAADAQRYQTAPDTVARHGVQQPGGQHCPGRPDRVAMRDGAAFDIDDVLGQVQPIGYRNGDGRKCLVDLGAFHIACRPPGAVKRLMNCRQRSKAEHPR